MGSGISEGRKTDNDVDDDKDSTDGSGIYHPGAAASNNVDFKAHLNAMLHNAVRLVVNVIQLAHGVVREAVVGL